MLFYTCTSFVCCIVGGTAGCVLASRLAEDPKINVLVLEAGYCTYPCQHGWSC